jgi:SAM-dependent MidA family methyltransferase
LGCAERGRNAPTHSRTPTTTIRLAALVRDRGPLTVAAFMDLALYDPEVGYYARAVQRSGRAGDFFTSVDVGPLFGELVEVQIAEMAALLSAGREPCGEAPPASAQPPVIHLVEAGAGNGRLSADILRAMRRRDPALYDRVRLHTAEASAAARAAQIDTLDGVADRLVSSSAHLPDSVEGILLANELLDAMPTHQVVMREDGLREVYVAADVHRERGEAGFYLTERQPSTPALQAYLDRLGVTLEPGWRVEINLAAVDWIRDAARRLTRGFIILFDYGHDAYDLYSPSHSAGTLTSFSRHRADGVEASPLSPPWLAGAGERDITAHVDFTSVRAAAEAEGMTTIAFLDQTYFLMGLLDAVSDPQTTLRDPQLKTLIMPGGLGSTMKVLILSKRVGAPALKGTSFKVRVT